MGRRNAVGVANGNFRAGDYYRYAEDIARGWNREPEHKVITKKKVRAAYWTQRLANAVYELKRADPNGWERWYDDDTHVPANAQDRENSRVVEARVVALTGSLPFYKARICRDIFIWQDQFGFFVYSKEAGKKPLYVIELDNFEAAEAFLRGLPNTHCGYGYVLDLLPARAMSMISTEA